MHNIQKWSFNLLYIIKDKITENVALFTHYVYKNATYCAKLAKNRYKNRKKWICTKCTKMWYNIKKDDELLMLLKGGVIMNNGKYDYKIICDYIIGYCQLYGNSITNLQLQKILYYVQGYFLKDYGYPAFDADIEAWQYGPVVPEAYYDFCSNGKNPLYINNPEYSVDKIQSKENRKLINNIVDKCIKMSIGNLIEKTHSELPWKNVWDNKLRSKSKISEDKILEYFDNNNPLGIKG